MGIPLVNKNLQNSTESDNEDQFPEVQEVKDKPLQHLNINTIEVKHSPARSPSDRSEDSFISDGAFSETEEFEGIY